jgi:predicted dehydrogenase
MSHLRAKITRRRFLGNATVAGAAIVAAPAFLRAREPNNKLNLAIVGCGGRGASNMKDVGSENIVALCDVNEANLLKAAEKAPQARKFRDFRKMYDELKDSQFDAVVVSSTEHTHAFATLPALKRKKHVYCEKPLTHNVKEARLIMAAAREAGVATQMGTQMHAGNNYRRVVEIVQGGVIGPVTETHVWVSRAWGWQSEEAAKKYKDIVWSYERPKDEVVPPRSLDWDLWLGPAPNRPFHPIYFPGPKWYRWWDFGSGTMSDLGAHWMDLPFWALKLDAPRVVEASGPPPHAEIAPASMSATFHFGSRGDMPPVKVSWYQGELKPSIWTEKKIPQWDYGVLFIGSQGMLLSDYTKHTLLPNMKAEAVKTPTKSIPDSIGHHAEWLHACKTGDPTTCPFSYSGLLTESNHLGSIAYRTGKRLEWDAKAMKITNCPEAEHLLGREYRKGWTLA